MTHAIEAGAELGRRDRNVMPAPIHSNIRRRSSGAIASLALVLVGFAADPGRVAAQSSEDQQWVGTWSASPSDATTGFSNQTLRLIAHASIGGDRVRVRLSNLFGTQSLVIGAAHVAISSGGPAIAAGSDRPLTFSGAPTITIPPGALVLSDPVRLDVPPLSDLAVSIYVPGDTGPATEHNL